MSTKLEQPISGGASFTPPPQSPSFSTFSSENIADVAARVVKELNLSHDDPFDDDFYSAFDHNFNVSLSHPEKPDDEVDEQEEEEEDEEESEFEFAILNREDNISPISADEIFSNGQIRPVYPIFNTDLVYRHHPEIIAQQPTTIRVPLRKFFEESKETGNGAVSCSSSEADDELEGVPPGTYCVWTPKKKEEIMMRKKSKSTSTTTTTSNNNSSNNGASRRWKFMNLLHRSNSDGKDTFVFLTPSSSSTTVNGNGKKMVVKKGEEKRKSYLPYRQDLVGFFTNVNGISRNVRPF